jgi:hypothetical protein
MLLCVGSFFIRFVAEMKFVPTHFSASLPFLSAWDQFSESHWTNDDNLWTQKVLKQHKCCGIIFHHYFALKARGDENRIGRMNVGKHDERGELMLWCLNLAMAWFGLQWVSHLSSPVKRWELGGKTALIGRIVEGFLSSFRELLKVEMSLLTCSLTKVVSSSGLSSRLPLTPNSPSKLFSPTHLHLFTNHVLSHHENIIYSVAVNSIWRLVTRLDAKVWKEILHSAVHDSLPRISSNDWQVIVRQQPRHSAYIEQ